MPFIRGNSNQGETGSGRGRGRSNISTSITSVPPQDGTDIEANIFGLPYRTARTNPPNRRAGNPFNPNAGFREGGTRTKIPQDCVDAASTMKFESNQARLDFLADCAASNADDTEITSSVEETGGDSNGNPQQDTTTGAKIDKLPKVLPWIIVAAAGIYIAYNRGLFKSNKI